MRVYINSFQQEDGMDKNDCKFQISEWRKKAWSIPDLRGGKQQWVKLVFGIVEYIDKNKSCNINDYPMVAGVTNIQYMREYYPFLKGIGLVRKQSDSVVLTKEGIKFSDNMSKDELADLIHNRYRLFGEMLNILTEHSLSISETDNLICSQYGLHWTNLNNTRKRMDWLEVLDLIEPLGNNKWRATSVGKNKIENWRLVSPEAIEHMESERVDDIIIQEPPEEISMLLQPLFDLPSLHKKRSTYNIWIPSPNRIDNLRTIIQFVYQRTSKKEFFKLVGEEFSLKSSSIESMMPFLKVSGLIEEVGRSIFIATPAAKAWLETGNDLDFIRILRCNMRFVGEIIRETENNITRNSLYEISRLYGLNAEKTRWLVGFLIEAGLVEEPQYLHLQATPLGKAFAKHLPLEILEPTADLEKDNNEMSDKQTTDQYDDKLQVAINLLNEAAVNPMAENKASGVAFEEEIATVFCLMGFEAKRIGGSGDTDVIVKWKDDGKSHIAIVDGKSKSSGQVSHGDISDVAIETHKEKNNAEYVAIIGKSFSGDTIKNHARKKGFSLVTANDLCEIARSSHTLGLSLREMSLLFQVPNGMTLLNEIISEKQRTLDIISVVISKMYSEQEQLGDLSPRDMFLLLRNNPISPSLEELISVFKVLSKPEIGVFNADKPNSVSEHTVYSLADGKQVVRKLRALASAIENGIPD